MREIASGNPNSRIVADEMRGLSNEVHTYYIGREPNLDGSPEGEFGHIRFQNGPVREVGINGCHQEDLVEIVIDRLEAFQIGLFPCPENAKALEKFKEGLFWLGLRTKERSRRGVEGKSLP